MNLLAFDFGASNGRGIIGKYDGKKIEISDVHRFENIPVTIFDEINWDILRLYNELKIGIQKASLDYEINSIGIDTWGVDYGLINKKGKLVSNPYHYRDGRTSKIIEKVFEKIPKEKIYANTGISFEKFNTLFQLFAHNYFQAEELANTDKLLFLPDLFGYFLTGEISSEATVSATSQLINIGTQDWDKQIFDALSLPIEIMPKIVNPGTQKGSILKSIANELNVMEVPVINVAGHDTASAVFSVPNNGDNYAFMSSGTWSLMGVEVEKSIITKETLKQNLTNETCYKGYRLQKNIMGMWLLQECKRFWENESNRKLSYQELDEACIAAKEFESFIDVDCEAFYAPDNMPGKIMKYCESTNQPVPATVGEILKCINQSLAMKYRFELENIERVSGKKVNVLNIIGGGSKNIMLNQYTANSINRAVLSGPVEATALGNIAIQLISSGEVNNQREARELIKNSFEIKEYMPKNSSKWDTAYEKYTKIIK